MGRPRWWTRGSDATTATAPPPRAGKQQAADAERDENDDGGSTIRTLPPLRDRAPPTLGQRRRARAARLRPGADQVEDTTEELLEGCKAADVAAVRAARFGRPTWQETAPSPDPDESPGAAIDFVKRGLSLPPGSYARLEDGVGRALREIEGAAAAGFPPRERERAASGADVRAWRRAQLRMAAEAAAGVAAGAEAGAEPGADTESDAAALADAGGIWAEGDRGGGGEATGGAGGERLRRRYRARVAERTRLVRGRDEADVAWLKHKAYTRGLAAIRAARLGGEEERRRAVEGGGGGEGEALALAAASGDDGGGRRPSGQQQQQRQRQAAGTRAAYLASKGAPLDAIPAELIDLPPLAAAAEAARGARFSAALEAEARRLGLLAPATGEAEEEEGDGARGSAAAAAATGAARPCCAAGRAAAAERAALAAAAAVPAGVWGDDPAVREGVLAELRKRGVLRPAAAAAAAAAGADAAAAAGTAAGAAAAAAATPRSPADFLAPSRGAFDGPSESDPSMSVYTREHRARLRARRAEDGRLRARRLAFCAGLAGAALARAAVGWWRRRRGGGGGGGGGGKGRSRRAGGGEGASVAVTSGSLA